MQTSAAANRITTAAHSGNVNPNLSTSQILVSDWRLRNWLSDAGGPAWVAPDTHFTIFSAPGSGDWIRFFGIDWDLGFQDLGNNTPVTLPDGVTTITPYVSSIGVSAPTGLTKDLFCFYASHLRGGWDSGIYCMWCYSDGTNSWWSQPITVFQNIAVADWNEQSQLFITAPRLFTLGGFYWITALECSVEVNVVTYHLCYFRSTDGIHWSRPEYLAGVSSDPDEQNVGINKHNANAPFTLAKIQHGYLSVTGTTCYLVGPTGSFSCGATSLVGVTNSAKQLDITTDVLNWSYSQPTSPGARQVTFNLLNTDKKYDGEALLVPGAKITQQAGYGSDLVTLATLYIDEIRASEAVGETSYQNALTITAGDSSIRFRDLSEVVPLELDSPAQATFDQFCDLSGVAVTNGRFQIGYGGAGTDLTAIALDPNADTWDCLGYVPQKKRPDGSIEFQWQFANNIYSDPSTDTNVGVGAALQGMSDRQFWAAIYYPAYDGWRFGEFTPATSGRKIYTHTVHAPPIYDVVLVADTLYWVKAIQYHNKVFFYTSTDRITWTKRMETTLTANLGYWGLYARSVVTQSSAVGNTDATGGSVAMDTGGDPKWFAVRVQTGAKTSILTNFAGLFTQTDQPSDLTIGIAADNGAGTAPADITNTLNILYSASVKSLNYSGSDAPVWRGVPVPCDIRLAASTYYWIYVHFNSPLTGAQTWEWYTDSAGTHGTTVSSTTKGATWGAESGKSMAACLFCDYDEGLTKFNKYYWTSGEEAHTLEDISHHIAAKGHVLNVTPDSFITDTTLVGGWQPSAYGTLGDFVLDCDVAGAGAQIYFRAQTNGNVATGYKVVIGSTMLIYKNNVLIESIASLQTIPTNYHLRIVNQTKWIYVWINEALACTCYNEDLTIPGYFGVGVATFTNLRIPDMTAIKPYQLVETGKTPQAALDDLVNKTKYKYFIRYDDSLRIGSFERRVSVDTYSSIIQGKEAVQTHRYAVNQIQPTGNYWAMRWAAKLLDAIGLRRYKKYDYTAAFSNEDAYRDGKLALIRAQEQGTPMSLHAPIAVLPAELEDQITNSLDGNDYIINDISIEWSPADGKADMTLGLRNIVE